MNNYTKVEIRWNSKRQCYIMDLAWTTPGHSYGRTGDKIFKVGKYYVQTKWGSGDPIAVYTSIDEMLSTMEIAYGMKPNITFK